MLYTNTSIFISFLARNRIVYLGNSQINKKICIYEENCYYS